MRGRDAPLRPLCADGLDLGLSGLFAIEDAGFCPELAVCDGSRGRENVGMPMPLIALGWGGVDCPINRDPVAIMEPLGKPLDHALSVVVGCLGG